MAELFAGDYGEAYFDNRWKIGLAHVRVGVKPWWVEAVTSFLRTEGLGLLTARSPTRAADPQRPGPGQDPRHRPDDHQPRVLGRRPSTG
jgi:hypothetical protein